MVQETAVASNGSGELVPILDDETKRAATTLFDLIGNATPVDASEMMGSGFAVVKDKVMMIDRPFWVVGITFNEGDQGEFVSLECVTGPNEQGLGAITGKYIINDGSTGIRDQVKEILGFLRGEVRPFFVNQGLRKSDYAKGDKATGFRLDPHGEPLPAGTTYYLNVAATAKA